MLKFTLIYLQCCFLAMYLLSYPLVAQEFEETDNLPPANHQILIASQLKIAEYQKTFNLIQDQLTSQGFRVSELDIDTDTPTQTNTRYDLVISIGSEAKKYVRTHFHQNTQITAFVLSHKNELEGSQVRDDEVKDNEIKRNQVKPDTYTLSALISPQAYIEQFVAIHPELKKIGILYDKDKESSFIESLKLAAQSYDLQIIAEPVKSKKQFPLKLKSVMQQDLDVFFILPNFSLFDRQTFQFTLITTYQKGVPTIGPAGPHVKSGSLWGLSVTPETIAKETVKLAVSLLENNNSPLVTKEKWRYAENYQLYYNRLTANKLALSIPQAWLLAQGAIEYGN